MRTSSATGLESSSANVDRNALEYGSSTYVDFFSNIGTSNNVQFWSKKFSNTAPPLAEYKLNFDAAVFPNLQCSGFGAIIRNANREVMAGMSAKGPYVHSSEEAEVMACRKVIEFSMEAGFARLIIEGDSLNVINSLSDSAGNRSLLGHIYDDIKCLLRGMHVLSFSSVKRCGNMVACSLAIC